MVGDQQTALFGQTCFEPGMAKNTGMAQVALCWRILVQAAPISQHGLINCLRLKSTYTSIRT